MADLTLSLVGADRPGIVASITGALVEVGGNVGSCRAAQMLGSFAVILAVSVPDDTSMADIERHLAPLVEDEGLSISVAPCMSGAKDGRREHCVVSVYGPDRPGIVHDAATALSGIGVKIGRAHV